MKKPSLPGGPSANGQASLTLEALCREFPLLGEFLADPHWDDGSERQTGTLLFFVDQGFLKASLHDRELQRAAFLTAPTLTEALLAVEDGLLEGTLDWRPKPAWNGQRKSR